MRNKDELALSFFPIDKNDFTFEVFRKKYESETLEDVPDDWHRYKLPIKEVDKTNISDVNYNSYWISFNPQSSLKRFICHSSSYNLYLTRRFLFRLLCSSIENNLDSKDYLIKEGFRPRVYLCLKEHSEGKEEVWLEPYYLKRESKFGFLCDYHFHKSDEQEFNRKVQKLSLSLKENGRENVDYYIDKSEKITEFLNHQFPKISKISEAKDLQIEKKFQKLTSESLDTKTYLFKDGEENNSQFMGLRKIGPKDNTLNQNSFCFLFWAEGKKLSYDLLKALKGESFSTFSGMEQMFGVNFDNSNIHGIEIKNFNRKEFDKKIDELKKISNPPPLPIVLIPWDKNTATPEENELYFYAKYRFLKERIPTQFVGINVLKDPERLKWSVSNIALQIFAKMGGTPWIVKPENKNGLIIGIGKAHKYVDDTIEKYFAYSVQTDTSGIYDDIKVLSETNSEKKYLEQLRKQLHDLLEERHQDFDSVTIHSTFKISSEELKAIRETVEFFGKKEERKNFVVLKINDKNKFFAYSPSHNSLVPYESTYTSISYNEFLIWFEGLQYHKDRVHKRYGGPSHVEFLYTNVELTLAEKKSYLQDTLNLSGANWRGFNAKSNPVSVFYAKLIAKYFKEFYSLGYDDLDVENLSPWFL